MRWRMMAAVIVVMSLKVVCVLAQQPPEGGYEVHDKRRPQPAAVEPPTPSTQDQPGKPPSDATVLFDGTDLSKWSAGVPFDAADPAKWISAKDEAKGKPAPWKV